MGIGAPDDPFDDSEEARSEPPAPDEVARAFAPYPSVAELALEGLDRRRASA